MDQSIEQKINERMAELPEDVLSAITSSELEKKLRLIGGKHHLHLDQMGKLEDETMLVMLAFVEPTAFATNLAHQLNVVQAEADAIATEIGNEIFMPIRHSMQAFVEEHTHEEHENGPTNSEAPQKVGVSTHTATPKTAAPTLHPADMMLSQKTVTVPPKAPDTAALPTKPSGYKADPYREPPVP